MTITIDPEFHSLIPPLTTDERRQLEENIIADGVRDPLVVWGDILVDGHNRHEICERLNIPYTTVSKSFDSRDDVKAWIIRNQFGRRNLSTFHRAELALQLEPLIAAKAKANQIEGGAIGADMTNRGLQNSANPALKPSFREAINTRAEVAKIAGVSHDTIHKAKVIRNEAPEVVKERLREGKTTINAVYETIRPHSKTKRTSSVRPASAEFVRPLGALPIPSKQISLPLDPEKAARAIALVFDRDFLTQFAAAILKGMSNDSSECNDDVHGPDAGDAGTRDEVA